MLLDDDVVTDGEAEAGPFSCGLRREEGIEHFLFHLGRNARAVVADCYLDTIAQILSCVSQSWLVIAAIAFGSAFGRCVKAIGDQIKQIPRDVLWEDVGLAREERLRRVLHDYFAWATTTTMARYHQSAEDVPDGLQIPKWSWDGRAG